MNRLATILGLSALVGLTGCSIPFANLLAPAAVTTPKVSTAGNTVTANMGFTNGRTIELNLQGPKEAQFSAQAIVHRWTLKDIYQYEVTLSREGQALVVVPVRCTEGKAKAIFTHLKPGVLYTVSVSAKGNVGGTAPELVLNSQTHAEGEFDFRGANDVEDHQSITIRVKLDDVVFDGTGKVNIETEEGTYQNPTLGESGTAECCNPTPAPTATPSQPAGTILNTYNVGGTPYGIAFDSGNNPWVTFTSNNTVNKFSYDVGPILSSFGVGALPYNIAIDQSDNLWVANTHSYSLSKLSPAGELLWSYYIGAEPTGIAFDAVGNAWVSIANAHQIMKFSNSGEVISSFPAAGSFPQSIAFDANGNAWIANFSSSTITKHAASGAELSRLPIGDRPSGMAVDSTGFLWVSLFDSSTVAKLDTNGTVLGTYAVGSHPHQISFDKNGYLWVACMDGTIRRIQP